MGGMCTYRQKMPHREVYESTSELVTFAIGYYRRREGNRWIFSRIGIYYLKGAIRVVVDVLFTQSVSLSFVSTRFFKCLLDIKRVSVDGIDG